MSVSVGLRPGGALVQYEFAFGDYEIVEPYPFVVSEQSPVSEPETSAPIGEKWWLSEPYLSRETLASLRQYHARSKAK